MYIFFLSVITYLLLSWSGGGFSFTELCIAIFLGIFLFLFNRSFFGGTWGLRNLGKGIPRAGRFLYYFFGPFMVALAKANLHMAKLVVTGQISPGIVKVPAKGLGEAGITLLANSITLTPGTLTVDVDEEEECCYVHCVDLVEPDPAPEEVYGSFGYWARRITQ